MFTNDIPAPGEGEKTEAVVKWFNLSKGFGFVAPIDGSPDAFMHMSVLARAGLQQIAEGTKLSVQIGPGPKGCQVIQIYDVLGMTDVPAPAPRAAAPTGPTEELTGTVKWFKGEKGFGFATPDDNGKDVFIHKNVVLQAGFSSLDEGQKLRMIVQTASKGREAVSIELIG